MASLKALLSFSYYMILIYVKYLPGDIFTNNFSSGISEVIACITAGYIYSRIGMKPAFTICMTVTAIGGLLIMILGENKALMPFFVILVKFGVASGFCISYIADKDVFPMPIRSTALGIITLSGGLLAIFSGLVAETKAPLPMLLLTSLNAVGIIIV